MATAKCFVAITKRIKIRVQSLLNKQNRDSIKIISHRPIHRTGVGAYSKVSITDAYYPILLILGEFYFRISQGLDDSLLDVP